VRLAAGIILLALVSLGITPADVSAQARPMPTESLRGCADCHLEWAESFNTPQAVLLIDRPSEPVEAKSETCLGCHDGSMEDSRRRVWLDHGHKLGVEPPSDMNVPEKLPLKDGKIDCRTCHTAHQTPAGSKTETLANVVLLRVPNDKSQLCQMCHTDKNKGPEEGTHPIKGMPEPIPAVLIEAGAEAHHGQKDIYCQVCHTPHGSKEDHLLVMGVRNNNLCLTCHETLRPGMWHAQRPGVHPDRPEIHSSKQMAAIETMGTRLGDENRLICLSCHKMHDGKSGRFMLAMTLKDSQFCIQCHEDQNILLESKHDISKLTFAVQNRLGFTTEQAGPCSACHMFHNLALEPNPSKQDPEGVCTSCHRKEGVAHHTGQKIGDLAKSHAMNIPVPTMTPAESLPLFASQSESTPQSVMTCQTCHDPHGSTQTDFLRLPSEDMCQACHPDTLKQITGGAHDIQVSQADWPQAAAKNSRCFGCHKVHSWDADANLWAVKPDENETAADAVCISCHQEARWSTADTPAAKAMLHPRLVAKGTSSNLLNLDTDPAQEITSCQSCHDPHGQPGVKSLLHASAKSHPEQLCYTCHDETRSLSQSMHSRFVFAEEKSTSRQVCGPCHAVHAVEGSTKSKMWAAKISEQGNSESAQRCLGCHGPDGTARKMEIVEHPEPLLMEFVSRQWLQKILPVSEDHDGKEITCLTCHLPHGRIHTPVIQEETETGFDLHQTRAAKPMLRPDTANQLCAQCHGFDAARLYLYYHYPSKRPRQMIPAPYR
jgi:predicted CXXCH cytochrome family protein